MRSIRLSKNADLLKRVLSVDDMYNSLVYDGSPSLEDFKLEGVWFLLIDGSDIAGLINILPMNNVMWTAHIFIFELYRMKGTEQWGTLVAQYAARHLGVEKFLAITPYEAAKKYAERMGFKYVATLNNSIKKNGKLMDQYMLELNVGEETK